MNVEKTTESDAAESVSNGGAILGAYAIQLLTPIPYWPGLPLANLGLVILLIVLLRQESNFRDYRTFVRLALFSGLLLIAAISNDVLIRLGLCAICLSSSQTPSWLFRWFLGWWMYLLLFNLCAPVHYLVQTLSTWLSHAAWFAALGWFRHRPRFFFGPDISQISFLLLWHVLFAASVRRFRRLSRSSGKAVVLSLILIVSELNFINSHYSDLNIQLSAFFNFLFLPAYFVWSLSRTAGRGLRWQRTAQTPRFRFGATERDDREYGPAR